MQALLAVIGSIVSGEAADAIGRARRAAVIYAIAGLLGLVGALFLLAAAYLATAREIGAVNAGLWFGGGFLAVAVLLVVFHKVGSRMRARRVAERRKAETRTVVSTAAVALLPALLASRGGAVALLVPAAAALGYAVYRENARRSRGPFKDDPRG